MCLLKNKEYDKIWQVLGDTVRRVNKIDRTSRKDLMELSAEDVPFLEKTNDDDLNSEE